MEAFLAFIIANQAALIAIAGAIMLEFAPVINGWFEKLSSAQRFWAFFVFSMSQAVGLGLWEALQLGWPGWEAIPPILLDALLAWLAGSGWHLIYTRYKTSREVKAYLAKQKNWLENDNIPL
jgi:hypothetical protein